MKYLTIKQNLRRLRIEKAKLYLTYFGISFMLAIALFILYICATGGNDTTKLNKCLQHHDLTYCNYN